MKRRLLALTIAIAATATLGGAASGDGGPAAQGVALFGSGVLSPNGNTRYVAVPDGANTMLVQILIRNGTILRTLTIPGPYGLPYVANDGTVGGLSFDGKVLVLAAYGVTGGRGRSSTFALVDVKRWRFDRTFRLRGVFNVDALSPKGRMLYLIEHVSFRDYSRYRVRGYDLRYGRLLPHAIVDRRARSEQMAGWPVTRALGPGGNWAYTLYERQNGSSFVHALDTRHAQAVCIDLPRSPTRNWIAQATMRVSRDGSRLDLRVYATHRTVLVISTRTYRVDVVRRV